MEIQKGLVCTRSFTNLGVHFFAVLYRNEQQYHLAIATPCNLIKEMPINSKSQHNPEGKQQPLTKPLPNQSNTSSRNFLQHQLIAIPRHPLAYTDFYRSPSQLNTCIGPLGRIFALDSFHIYVQPGIIIPFFDNFKTSSPHVTTSDLDLAGYDAFPVRGIENDLRSRGADVGGTELTTVCGDRRHEFDCCGSTTDRSNDFWVGNERV